MQSPASPIRHASKRQRSVALGRTRQISVFLAVLWLAIAGGVLPGPARAEVVDLELVFAVDASGSVDPGEYQLQLNGIATAITDAEVLQAIGRGTIGKIAVNMLVWAQAGHPKSETGWFTIGTPQEAAVFSNLVASFPRAQRGGTGLGDGIAKSVTSILNNRFTAARMVIDVSGDGRETPPRDHVVMLPQARTMANYHGITVNGLAILNDDPLLDTYYRNWMITGQGSFVELAQDYRDFARAMRKKLLREIEEQPIVSMRAE